MQGIFWTNIIFTILMIQGNLKTKIPEMQPRPPQIITLKINKVKRTSDLNLALAYYGRDYSSQKSLKYLYTTHEPDIFDDLNFSNLN